MHQPRTAANPPRLVTADNLALQTDLYELTMAQAYLASGRTATATFDLFIRRFSLDHTGKPRRNYFVAAGLADTLDLIESFHFPQPLLDHLQRTDRFSTDFLHHLASLRFTGDIHAVPEGTPAFPAEPLLRVTAPIIQAQLLEPLVMNQLGFQTLIASKASRITHAAADTPCIDFGLRRAHALDAGLKAARAAYIAGFTATSNTLAEHLYAIPAAGTMAHAFIEAFDHERDAFQAFANQFPATTLLVDTYDTLKGIDTAIKLYHDLPQAHRFAALRLDSGDLEQLAKHARAKLDDAGLNHIKLFASSSLDEHEIQRLRDANAPIDGFGVGTALTTAADAPDLDTAYKLAHYDNKPRMKSSTDKSTLPAVKQVYRLNPGQPDMHDLITRDNEPAPDNATPLLAPVMTGGTRTADAPRSTKEHLDAARDRHASLTAQLPEHIRSLTPADPAYPVRISDELAALRDALAAEHTR